MLQGCVNSWKNRNGGRVAEDTKSAMTEDTKSVIVDTKQYLKMEYKVSYFIHSFSHLHISPLKNTCFFPTSSPILMFCLNPYDGFLMDFLIMIFIFFFRCMYQIRVIFLIIAVSLHCIKSWQWRIS